MNWILMVLLPMPIYLDMARDPSPGWTESKMESRNYDCERLGVREAHRLYPETVPAPVPRGDFAERSAMVCQRRVVDLGRRPAHQEVVLSDLTSTVNQFAETAARVVPSGKTILVEVYHHDPALNDKIAFAMKTALVEVGQRVSDRVPVLAPGDVSVLVRAPITQSARLACRRYRDSLGEDDVLLGIVLLDERSTQLQLGLCSGGEWSWL